MSRVGDPIGPATFGPVTAATIREWATVLRDPNPIHLDAAAARAKGLGDRPIVQGPLTIACLNALAMRAFPGMRVARLQSRLVGVAYQDEILEGSGEVIADDDEGVTCTLRLSAQERGDLVLGEVRLSRT